MLVPSGSFLRGNLGLLPGRKSFLLMLRSQVAGVAAPMPDPFCGNCDSAPYVSITARSRRNNSNTPQLAQTPRQDRSKTLSARDHLPANNALPALTHISTQTGMGDLSATSWTWVSQKQYQETYKTQALIKQWYGMKEYFFFRSFSLTISSHRSSF